MPLPGLRGVEKRSILTRPGLLADRCATSGRGSRARQGSRVRVLNIEPNSASFLTLKRESN